MLILKQLLLFVNLDKEGVRDRLVMDIGKKRRRTFSMKHDIFVTPPPGADTDTNHDQRTPRDFFVCWVSEKNIGEVEI